MRIDPTTLLFENIDPETQYEMYRVTKALVLKGEVPHPRPEWLEEWLRAAGYDDRQALLAMSTSLPARVLLSLLQASGFEGENRTLVSLDIRKAEGRVIRRLYFDDWANKPAEVEAQVPGSDKLFNFWADDYIVLDPYGDDLPDTIRNRTFGAEARFTLAINRVDGSIATAHFLIDEDGVPALYLNTLPRGRVDDDPVYRIPQPYRDRLGELLSKKRPYRWNVDPSDFEALLDQSIGYPELSFVIRLDFDGETLEVSDDMWRRTSDWHSHPENP